MSLSQLFHRGHMNDERMNLLSLFILLWTHRPKTLSVSLSTWRGFCFSMSIKYFSFDSLHYRQTAGHLERRWGTKISVPSHSEGTCHKWKIPIFHRHSKERYILLVYSDRGNRENSGETVREQKTENILVERKILPIREERDKMNQTVSGFSDICDLTTNSTAAISKNRCKY